MCRLFGLHAGTAVVDAAFWLVDAADSLAVQSHRYPDGFGIGTFAPDGTPVVDKAPRPAWRDRDFAAAAHAVHGTTFVAHVRAASTGPPTDANTHPFLQRGRLLAHNGALQGLELLDARLVELDARDLVVGDTDSERMFALITAETERAGGDVAAGIERAVRWIAHTLPIYSLNLILTTPNELWALRFPAANGLFVLERPAGSAPLEAVGSRLEARSTRLAEHPSFVVASERMDGETGWRPLAPGELLHVGPTLAVTSRTLDFAPAHPLTLAQLDPVTAGSQLP
jgi:predicted glutamine amidotransferase